MSGGCRPGVASGRWRQFAGRRPVFGIDLRCQCADKDGPTVEQTRVFEAAATLRHIIRAVRFARQFWALDLGPEIAPEHLENLPQAIFLAAASERAVFANAAAKAMLDAGDGMLLRDGRLATADGSDVLAKLIASCAREPRPRLADPAANSPSRAISAARPSR